jgi:predicted 3-demethylubiquinone-9 3-methyltransferase (glyoxalase superfamily)
LKFESEASLSHTHYHQLLSSERAKASEQLPSAQRRSAYKRRERRAAAVYDLYDTSLANTDELVKEIQKIKDAMRRTRREKVEMEKQYCAAVNAAQGRAEDMHRIKDEWGVTQALNVRLYAERLTRELEEARDRLLKVCIFASFCSWSRSKRVDIL